MKCCRLWAWMFAVCILGASVWAPAQVVINEVAYDPEGDLSGDGTVSETGDEFIELYNAGGASADISSAQASISAKLAHSDGRWT